jgi:hypothetical protein
VDSVIGIVLVLLGEAAISFRDVLFVKDGVGDHVFFGSPRAKIGQPATVAAEREIGVVIGIRGFLANGTFVLHGLGEVLPQRLRTRQRETRKAFFRG